VTRTAPDAAFAPFAEKMAAAGLPEVAIRNFRHYYEQLAEGRTGLIPEAEIEPVGALPDAEALPAEMAAIGEAALSRTVMVKLNGGLGTGMGLEKAKSLLVVKDGLTFLDIVARQALHSGTPLVLMNSYNTRDDSLSLLQAYPELWGGIPLDFAQHMVPKVDQATLGPVSWPQEPELEWCPPGHGDIYVALVTSGMLEKLRDAGYEYAFSSNVDNLGAVIEPAILGYFASRRLPFMMEVADRTEADQKGGHLARRKGTGRLLLRETAQYPPEDADAYQDITRHRYFNTNNVWINLEALAELLARTGNVLDLPLIRNSKTIDPRDSASPPAYQLETAMGAAIELFDGAGALRAPRSRFAPVKSTNDLLGVRSDAYLLTEDWRVVLDPRRGGSPPVVELDPRTYRLIDDFEARFPHGPPSLVECERLTVRGDVAFGAGVVCRGEVEVSVEAIAPGDVANGALIEGNVLL
jgi:UTP--glucose-1-phosphate uridylyltransferase